MGVTEQVSRAHWTSPSGKMNRQVSSGHGRDTYRARPESRANASRTGETRSGGALWIRTGERGCGLKASTSFTLPWWDGDGAVLGEER